MKIKEVFAQAEDGTLTYEQFQKIVKEANAKFADLSEGEYVSKGKYDDELASLNAQIETLNGTIGTRDTDLEALKQQLAEAGTDAEKLSTLSNDFTKRTISGYSSPVLTNIAGTFGYISLTRCNNAVESLPPENDTYTLPSQCSYHALMRFFVMLIFADSGSDCI